jgi:hypothetical protein
MEIDLLFLPDCPNRRAALNLVALALARTHLVAIVREREVRSPGDARRLGMRGSPTFLIDGADPFADESQPTGLACRLYRSDAGLSGVPMLGQLVEALGGRMEA